MLGFGYKEVYDYGKSKGYSENEAKALASVAAFGLLATDALDLAGPGGFAANVALDTGITQLATGGYESLRNWLRGDEQEVPEDVLGTLPKGDSIDDANKNSAGYREKAAIKGYKDGQK